MVDAAPAPAPAPAPESKPAPAPSETGDNFQKEVDKKKESAASGNTSEPTGAPPESGAAPSASGPAPGASGDGPSPGKGSNASGSGSAAPSGDNPPESEINALSAAPGGSGGAGGASGGVANPGGGADASGSGSAAPSGDNPPKSEMNALATGSSGSSGGASGASGGVANPGDGADASGSDGAAPSGDNPPKSEMNALATGSSGSSGGSDGASGGAPSPGDGADASGSDGAAPSGDGEVGALATGSSGSGDSGGASGGAPSPGDGADASGSDGAAPSGDGEVDALATGSSGSGGSDGASGGVFDLNSTGAIEELEEIFAEASGDTSVLLDSLGLGSGGDPVVASSSGGASGPRDSIDLYVEGLGVTGGSEAIDKWLVDNGYNPEQIHAALASGPDVEDITKSGSQHAVVTEIPELKDLDVLGMETDIDDGSGGKLTVGEATIDKLITDYAAMIDSGEIGRDDPRYKVFMAVMAQTDLANGREVIPYREEKIAGGTERLEGNPVKATAADMAGLYDAAKVDEATAALFKDPAVAQDFDRIQDEFINNLGIDKKKLAENIMEFTSSDKFGDYIATMTKEGRTEEAIAAGQRIMASATAVMNEDQLNTFMGDITTTALVKEVDGILEKGLTEEVGAIAVYQWTAFALETINRGIQLGRHGMNNITYAEVKNGLLTMQHNKAWQSAMAEFAKYPGGAAQMPMDQFNKIMDKVDLKKLPDAQRGDFKKLMYNLNNAGAFSTAIGTIALAGAAIQMGVGNTGDPIQDLAVARNMLLFAGTAPEIAKFTAGKLNSTFGKYLHMGETVQIFSAKSIGDVFRTPSTQLDPKALKILDDAKVSLSGDESLIRRLSSRIGSSIISPVPGTVPANLAKKYTASAIKTLGSTSFTAFGVVDAVLGGLTLEKGINSGDKIVMAQGAMQIATGTATTVAGMGMVMGAFGVAPALTPLMISPLLATAAVLGFGIVGIDIVRGIVDRVKREDDIASINQLKYFNDQAAQGYMQDDWRDKHEFLVKSFYGKDEGGFLGPGINAARPKTPEGKSVFDTYDWQSFLGDSRMHIARNGEDTPWPIPLNEMTPEYKKMQERADSTLNRMAIHYNENINFDARGVPELDDPQIKKDFESLVEFYMAGNRQSFTGGDDARAASDTYSPQRAAEWAFNVLTGRVSNTFVGRTAATKDGRNPTRPANEEVTTMLENYWSKHGGKAKAENIARGVIGEGSGTPDQARENAINASASSYYNWFANKAPNGSNKGGTDNRTVPFMEGEIADHFQNLVDYYSTYTNPQTTPENASQWAWEEIRGRIENAFRGVDGGKIQLNDGTTIPMNWKDALDIMDGWITRHGGRQRLIELAEEILG